jgi:hypothetical protein
MKRKISTKLNISALLLASLLVSTPAGAYQLLSIPPNGLYLIICGNGNTFPWQTVGPDGVTVMNAVAIGLCQGTIVSNSHFDVRRLNVKRLLAEQKPRTFSEKAVENAGAASRRP